MTPGNPGHAGDGRRATPISVTAAPPEEIAADLFVIGPEAPLVDGLADRLRAAGHAGGRPGRRRGPARGLEGLHEGACSAEAGVPTARYGVFDDADAAARFLADAARARTWSRPTGWPPARACWSPTAGPRPRPTSRRSCRAQAFGDAGRRVVIEEGLVGFRVLDPRPVRRHAGGAARRGPRLQARRATGTAGANTGGMGCYSPLPEVDDELIGRVMDEAVEPIVAALRRRGHRLPGRAVRRDHGHGATGR